MPGKIEHIEGIGPAYAQKLRQAGIRSTHELLRQGASRPGRQRVAQLSGIEEARILKWVNMCDLFRIRGIASQYAELLEAAGVDTVKELRTRNADNLLQTMTAVNAEKRLVRQTPNLRQIADWIGQADRLEPLVTH